MEKKPDAPARTRANRENALKSTGPRDTSRTRHNALKHGLLSRNILLSGEEAGLLRELGERLSEELAPQGVLEALLVDRIVSSAWRLRRALAAERDCIQAVSDGSSSIDFFQQLSGTQATNVSLARSFAGKGALLSLMRYEAAFERQIYKALHELQRLQAARRGEEPPPPLAVDVEVSGPS